MRILETEHLIREFGGVIAVNDVDFQVEKGMVNGLIGPNGAGKLHSLTRLLVLISQQVVA